MVWAVVCVHCFTTYRGTLLNSHTLTVCLVCNGKADTQTHTHLAGGSHTDLRDYKLSPNTKWYLAGLATGAPQWCRVTEPITVCK